VLLQYRRHELFGLSGTDELAVVPVAAQMLTEIHHDDVIGGYIDIL
jgi:hypothetical protein